MLVIYEPESTHQRVSGEVHRDQLACGSRWSVVHDEDLEIIASRAIELQEQLVERIDNLLVLEGLVGRVAARVVQR